MALAIAQPFVAERLTVSENDVFCVEFRRVTRCGNVHEGCGICHHSLHINTRLSLLRDCTPGQMACYFSPLLAHPTSDNRHAQSTYYYFEGPHQSKNGHNCTVVLDSVV